MARAFVLAIVVAALCGCGSSGNGTGGTSSTPAAPAATSNGAKVIDGIKCQPEHLESHYHAHLTLLRNGKQVKVRCK